MKLLVPDDVIEGIRPLFEKEEDVQWACADYLVDVVDELGDEFKRAYGVRHGRREIHRQIANAIGRTIDTMRDREVMGRAWPPHVRVLYSPLTYHQLRACKGAGDKRFEYAEWALANLPAPVALIWARVRSNGDEVPAWVNRWERVQHLCALLVGDSDTPAEIRQACQGVLSLVSE